MKTLIFNGSPRKNGDTAAMIKLLTDKLSGEYKIVDCYNDDIFPCIDCRNCVDKPSCSIRDGMGEVYSYIEECDNVIIASPIFFSELTGRLLDVASRFQRYYCARAFRNEDTKIRPKKGGILLVGGGDGSCEKACSTATTLLRQINVTEIFEMICSHNTNKLSPDKDKDTVQKIEQLLNFLNFSDSEGKKASGRTVSRDVRKMVHQTRAREAQIRKRAFASQVNGESQSVQLMVQKMRSNKVKAETPQKNTAQSGSSSDVQNIVHKIRKGKSEK